MVSRRGVRPIVSTRIPIGREYLFDPNEWVAVQRDLVVVEGAMWILASGFGGTVLGDIRGGYPARRLRRTAGLNNWEFRVMLQPDYFADHVVSYVVSVFEWWGSGRVMIPGSHRIIRTIQTDELGDAESVAALLQECMT